MAKQPAPAIVTRRAWDPALLKPAEISSIKAIAAQHPLGFEAIVRKICRFYEVSFAAGDEAGRRETDYAEGKRAVGKMLLDIVAMKMPSPVRSAPPPDLPNSPTPTPEGD
jgi:hypothetical protein